MGASSGFGQRLKTAREKSGLTMAQLAGKVVTSKPTLSVMENGQQLPRIDLVERLSMVLNVRACWLAYGMLPISSRGLCLKKASCLRNRVSASKMEEVDDRAGALPQKCLLPQKSRVCLKNGGSK